MSTIFSQIVEGEIPARIVYEDETTVAFLDANPLAPGHTLVIPRDEYERLNDVPDDVAAASTTRFIAWSPPSRRASTPMRRPSRSTTAKRRARRSPMSTVTSSPASRATAAAPFTPSRAIGPTSATTNSTISPRTSSPDPDPGVGVASVSARRERRPNRDDGPVRPPRAPARAADREGTLERPAATRREDGAVGDSPVDGPSAVTFLPSACVARVWPSPASSPSCVPIPSPWLSNSAASSFAVCCSPGPSSSSRRAHRPAGATRGWR